MIFGFKTRKDYENLSKKRLELIEKLRYFLADEIEISKKLREENTAFSISKELLTKENDELRSTINAIFEKCLDVEEIIRE